MYGTLHLLRLVISLDFFSVLILFLWSEGSSNLAVEGSEVGFELLQFILLAPRLLDDGFEVGNSQFACGYHNSIVANISDNSVRKIFDALLRSYSRGEMLYFEL